MKSWVCPFHKTTHVQPEECRDCVRDMNLPLPTTHEDRAREIEKWADGVLTVNFSRLHKRMEGLCGRSVWTHEFARPEELAAEVRRGVAVDPEATAIEKIGRYAPHAEVIVVDVGSKEPKAGE